MQTRGLRLEDAPPLGVPLSFFVTAPCFMVVAGIVLLVEGASTFGSRWSALTISFTHLGTLGVVTMTMFGAIYALLAVVVGSPVRGRWTPHGVHALFVIGIPALAIGVASSSMPAMWVAITTLGPGALLFVLPVGRALRRAVQPGPMTIGLGLAVISFFLLAFLGIWMAHGHAGALFPGPRDLWVQVHVGVALFGWVGGLLTAVSWQVLSMFYLAREPEPALMRTLLVMTTAGVLLPVIVLTLDWFGASPGPPAELAALAMLPAPIAVLGLHPVASLLSLRARRRRRSDGSLLFWQTGLLAAPLGGIAFALAWLRPGERWEILFGWLLIWGWATTIIHGMLTRIVPFLVWLHRFAPRVGLAPVPSVKKLLPDAWTRIGFRLHLGTTLLGCAGIVSQSDALCRATGVALAATGAWLLRSILHLLRQHPPTDTHTRPPAQPDGDTAPT